MSGSRLALVRRRRALGYSQEDLAARLRVDRSTIGRWERGESEPQPWNRPALSRALEVTSAHLDALLRNEGLDVGRPRIPSSVVGPGDVERSERAAGRFTEPAAAESASLLDRATSHPRYGDVQTVAELRHSVQQLDALYDVTPSDALISQAGQLLGQISLLAAHTRSERTAQQLDGLEADAATLMGQLIWDVSQRRANNLSRGHFDRAVAAAQRSCDPAAEARALLRKSFVALYGEHDPHEGLALTHACATAAQGVSHVLQGLAILHAAEANAMLGDARECERSLIAAESQLAAVDSNDPAFNTYSTSQFERVAGSCYLFLGRPAQAEAILASAATSPDIPPKSRAIVLANLSLAHIRSGSVGSAVDTLHQAIDTVQATRGGGGMNLVFEAGRQLRAWRQAPEVVQLNDRLLMLMNA